MFADRPHELTAFREGLAERGAEFDGRPPVEGDRLVPEPEAQAVAVGFDAWSVRGTVLPCVRDSPWTT